MTIALAGFLVITGSGSTATPHMQADRGPAIAAAAIGLLLAGACVHIGRSQSSRGRAAALMGVALGAIYAATASLLKALGDIAVRHPTRLVASWQLYAALVLGAAGLFLAQLTFQASP